MDDEIRTTIDRRRIRTPKDLEHGDIIVLKADPHNALNIDADGPMVFLEYTSNERTAIRY